MDELNETAEQVPAELEADDELSGGERGAFVRDRAHRRLVDRRRNYASG